MAGSSWTGARLATCVVMEIQVTLDRFPGARLIDVREPYEYEAGHIPGIEHVPMERLRELEVSEGETIVFVCLSGARSGASGSSGGPSGSCAALTPRSSTSPVP